MLTSESYFFRTRLRKCIQCGVKMLGKGNAAKAEYIQDKICLFRNRTGWRTQDIFMELDKVQCAVLGYNLQVHLHLQVYLYHYSLQHMSTLRRVSVVRRLFALKTEAR